MESADSKRLTAADRLRVAHDVTLPVLKYWNASPCRRHMRWTDPETGLEVVNRPKDTCRDCGVILRRHQRVGIAWLYMVMQGGLFDTVGSGKTFQCAGVLALMRERAELSTKNRALIVMRPAALSQWRAQLHRVVPRIPVMVADDGPQARYAQYAAPWEVCLIGSQMLLRDIEILNEHFHFGALFVDDVDALRNFENKTSWAIKLLARQTPRVAVMTGTPLQKKLHELHSVLDTIGASCILGPREVFMRRYVREEKMVYYNRKTGRKSYRNTVVGYKNVNEFRSLIAPLVLRRTAEDIEDVDLPAIIPNDVLLDLYPLQRQAYNELKKGVIQLQKAEGNKVKRVTAMARLHTGAKICGGLAVIGGDDGPETSVKLDWITDKLTGDLEGEKVICFINYKDTIKVLQHRLDALKIGYVTYWGDENSKKVRDAAIRRFWEDPACMVLMGTTAIEQSLDLQVARHLVNVDMILNPARMEQLAGRIRRQGSAFKHVYVHNLLCTNTQEAKYLKVLEHEQALIDTVWDEESDLFEKLSPLALLQMITS